MRASNRLLIYLLYDPSGRVDLSVQRTLKAFREVCDQILVVSNGPLTENSKEVLSSLAETVLERPNTGYDVAAYRHAFAGLGARLRSFDELVLANSTFLSVDESFEHLFDRMEKDPADFWGLTDHPEITPHPYTGQGVMRAHLQTYWLVFRSRVLHSPEFKSFWDALPTPETYDQVVTTFETELSHFFSQRGFTWSAAFPAKDFGVDNPTMQAPVALLDSGCPIVKKRLYFHGTEHLMNTGVSVAEVTEAALRRGLTREVIADAILGRTEATQATVALGALYVVDEPALEPPDGDENRGAVHTTQRTQRPWKELLATNDDLRSDELLIVVPGSELEPRADGGIWRRHNALAAIKDGAERLAALMEAEPRLGMGDAGFVLLHRAGERRHIQTDAYDPARTSSRWGNRMDICDRLLRPLLCRGRANTHFPTELLHWSHRLLRHLHGSDLDFLCQAGRPIPRLMCRYV